MLKLIDRLRIRGVRGDYTRDEELKKLDEEFKKLNKTIEEIKARNTKLLQVPAEEFSKLRQKNKQQLSSYKVEFSHFKAKLKDENRRLISGHRKRLEELKTYSHKSLENLRMYLRRTMTFCY